MTALRAYSRSTSASIHQRKPTNTVSSASAYQSAPVFHCRHVSRRNNAATMAGSTSLPGREGGEREGVSVGHVGPAAAELLVLISSVLCCIRGIFGNKRRLAEQAVLGVFDDVVVVRSSGEAHHWKPTGRREARKQLEAWHDACLSLQLQCLSIHMHVYTSFHIAISRQTA